MKARRLEYSILEKIKVYTVEIVVQVASRGISLKPYLGVTLHPRILISITMTAHIFNNELCGKVYHKVSFILLNFIRKVMKEIFAKQHVHIVLNIY